MSFFELKYSMGTIPNGGNFACSSLSSSVSNSSSRNLEAPDSRQKCGHLNITNIHWKMVCK
jgi:hypothetical protein